MGKMPVVELSQLEYQALMKMPHDLHGEEAVICPTGNASTRFKLFKNTLTGDTTMCDNKVCKVVELYKKNLPCLVRPVKLVSCSGRIVGYEMEYDEEDVSLSSLILSRKEKIRVLKDSREALIFLGNHNIVYGDVTASNLLVNTRTRKVKFCDIDNIKVGEMPIDLKISPLIRFYERTGVIDSRADAYMHNLLTIKELSSDVRYECDIIKDLRKSVYPTKFKLGAQPIFESMQNPEKFNGEYVVQYIKR